LVKLQRVTRTLALAHVVRDAVGLSGHIIAQVLGRTLDGVRAVLAPEHSARYASFVEGRPMGDAFYDPATCSCRRIRGGRLRSPGHLKLRGSGRAAGSAAASA
jgi:hypothetical protein